MDDLTDESENYVWEVLPDFLNRRVADEHREELRATLRKIEAAVERRVSRSGACFDPAHWPSDVQDDIA